MAIHGPNGAGKTNLLEAISLLSPGRGLRGAGAAELPRAGGETWRIAADIASPDGAHEVLIEGTAAGRRVEIDGKAAPQAGLGAVARVLWLTPAMDRLWLEGAETRRRFLDRIALSLIPEHGAAAIAYDRALRERNRLLRDGARDRAWYLALEGQLAGHGARLAANRRRALAELAAAESATTEDVFPVPDLALASEAPQDADDLAAALADGRERDMAAGRTLTGPHRDDLVARFAVKDVPARLASTGEQKALLLSVVLANARAVAAVFGAPPILLLDEVAAHLDAGRCAALFDRIAGLGAQAFLTGTGPELFDAFGTRAARLGIGEEGGLSAVDTRG